MTEGEKKKRVRKGVRGEGKLRDEKSVKNSSQ